MNKTDKQLLQDAAICHGVKARWYEKSKWKTLDGRKWKVGDGARFYAGSEPFFGTHSTTPWNPLEDSGLAFAIAAEHELFVSHADKVRLYYDKALTQGGNKEKALRKAIVLTLVAISGNTQELQKVQLAKEVEDFAAQLEKARSKKTSKRRQHPDNLYEPGRSTVVDEGLIALDVQFDAFNRPSWWDLVDLFFEKNKMLEQAQIALEFAKEKPTKVRRVNKTST